MTAAALPTNEAERLAALRGLNILDTAPEPTFDSLARLAAHVCRTPIALVSLVDEKRQWFKARFGLDVMETPRDIAFCAHAILQDPLLEVCDAQHDARFAGNPLVTGPPQIRFYAGVPIRTSDGHALGTVCVIDFVPRRLDDEQRWTLRALAEQAASQMELRCSAAEAAEALRALDEERVLLRGVLHGVTEYSVVGTTPRGTITVFNRGAELLFGYRADEVVGRATPELLHDAAELAGRAVELDVASGFEALTARARRGDRDRRESLCRRKSGELFPADETIAAMRNESNEITGFLGITRDLSEERRAERERLRLADERMARAAADRTVSRLARLHDVAVALAPAMTSRQVFTLFVRHACAAVGAKSSALMVMTDGDTRLELGASVGLPPEVVAALETLPVSVARPLTDALRDGCPVFVEDVAREARYPSLLARSSALQERALAAVPLLAEGRRLGTFRFGFADPRVFGEEDRIFLLALGRLGAQAIERARAYEAEAAAHRAAEAANHAKDEFIAVLSHELRTPLTAVLGWGNLLRAAANDQATPLDRARLCRGLAVIENNAQALLRFVEAILEVNRIVAGTLALACAPVDLGAMVRETVLAMKPLADAAHLTLTITVTPGMASISADPHRLRQIITNLIANAIKFTPSEGHVDVTVDPVGDQVRLCVVDNGEGIAPEFLGHMFERFVQADGTRTRAHGGLGIGLAIVKHLVELHGGTVAAKSAGRGCGAELIVLLPAGPPLDDAEGAG